MGTSCTEHMSLPVVEGTAVQQVTASVHPPQALRADTNLNQ